MGRGSSRAGRPRRWAPPPRDGRGGRSSQVVTGAGTRLGKSLGVLPGFPLTHGLVHGAFEVVAQVLAELPSHLLHEAAHAGRIVLVEVAEAARVAQGLQPLVLRLDAREARHDARQRRAAALRTGGRGGCRGAQDEETHPPSTAMAVVLVDRHGGTDLTMWARIARVPTGAVIRGPGRSPPGATPRVPSRRPWSPGPAPPRRGAGAARVRQSWSSTWRRDRRRRAGARPAR